MKDKESYRVWKESLKEKTGLATDTELMNELLYSDRKLLKEKLGKLNMVKRQDLFFMNHTLL